MTTTELTSRQAVPVLMDGFVLYCEEFKASGVRSLREEADVNGDAAFTGGFPKSKKLVFSGRIYSETAPLGFIYKMDALLRSGRGFYIEYRGLVFRKCRVQAFSVDDGGDDYIKASVTLVTSAPVETLFEEE